MKEFDFITVHDRDTNNLVIINIKYIYRITVEEYEKKPIIIFNYDNDKYSLEMKETPDKILNKIKEKGYKNFIKLHDTANYPEILNMNYIAVISKDDDKICCKFCDHYYTANVEVIEKLEKIEEIIKNLG